MPLPDEPSPFAPAVPAMVAAEVIPQNMMVYVLNGGKLVLTPMANIAGLVHEIDVADGLAAASQASNGALSASSSVSTGTVLATTTAATGSSTPATLSTTVTPASEGSESSGVADSSSPTASAQVTSNPMAMTSGTAAAQTVTTIPSTTETSEPVLDAALPVDLTHLHDKRAPEADLRYIAPSPKLMGLQGALAANPAISAPAYPTAVSCTKLYIKEKTVWKPATGDPSFVAATPRTNYITTISTLTVSSTVPDRKPFKTASFVTTSTITTTTTFVAVSYTHLTLPTKRIV